MADYEKHRDRFQGRKKDIDNRRKYDEYKRRQYEKLSEAGTSKSAEVNRGGESDTDQLEVFLQDMRSTSDVDEIDLAPELVDLSGSYVFTLTWDVGGTNNGVWSVVSVGPYYFCDISSGTFGPFTTLADALEWSEMTTITTATESIETSEMTTSELAKILSPSDEVKKGFQLMLNDEIWELNWRGTWSKTAKSD